MNDEKKERRGWKHGRGAVRKLGRCFWIRYTMSGRPIEEKTDAKNATEARNILNERLGDVSKGVTPAAASRTRLAELYADMKADYRNNGQDLSILAKRWKHIEPVFGNDLVSTITSARLQRYVDVRRGYERAAPATVQREIAALRRMFRLGYAARSSEGRAATGLPEDHRAERSKRLLRARRVRARARRVARVPAPTRHGRILARLEARGTPRSQVAAGRFDARHGFPRCRDDEER